MWFVRKNCITEILRRKGVTKGSIVENMALFRSEDIESVIDSVEAQVSEAHHFISYTRSIEFDTLEDYLSQPIFEGKFIWMDLFCIDQLA